MSKIKKGFEDFKEDPLEWRKGTWDALDEKKIKPYNFLVKLLLLILGVMLLMLSLVYLICLPLGIIVLILSYKFDARKMKKKLGSKE
ncbi:hypothetical protein L0P85_06595 [Terrisporobacter glycolicus]|nr:hypothetical protein L0P85_06595 [Terrisporobacter glycolicus]